MNLLRVFEMLSRMADVRRYSMIRLATAESVLEHTAFVALIGLLISIEINLIGSPNSSSRRIVDLEWMMAKALLHDVEETVTGDIPRPTKYHSSDTREMFRKIEEEGMGRVLAGLEISEPAVDQIGFYRDQAKLGTSGIVVDLADTLAVVYKSHDEVVLRSNRSMKKVAASTLPDLVRLRDKIRGGAEFAGRQEAIDYLIGIIEDAEKIVGEACSD